MSVQLGLLQNTNSIRSLRICVDYVCLTQYGLYGHVHTSTGHMTALYATSGTKGIDKV